jgi:hypothetical protein
MLLWRHRFLDGMKADRSTMLQGVGEADETHFLESRKGSQAGPASASARW